MALDRTTEAIAHFGGWFHLSAEQARMRSEYDLFRYERAKQEEAEEREPQNLIVNHSYKLKAYSPGVDYEPKFTPSNDAIPPAESNAIVPTPYNISIESRDAPTPDPQLPAGQQSSGFSINFELQPPSSVIFAAFQYADLSDNDTFGSHAADASFSTANFKNVLTELEEFADVLSPIEIAEFPSAENAEEIAHDLIAQIDAVVSAYDATHADSVSGEPEGPTASEPGNAPGLSVSVISSDAAKGIFADGEELEEMPEWDALRPDYFDDEDDQDGSSANEESDGSTDTQFVEQETLSTDDPGEHDFSNDFETEILDPNEIEPGHEVVAGANSMINNVGIASSWLDAPVIVVGGDYVELDIATQVNVLVDYNIGPGGTSSDYGSTVMNVAKFEEKSSEETETSEDGTDTEDQAAATSSGTEPDDSQEDTEESDLQSPGDSVSEPDVSEQSELTLGDGTTATDGQTEAVRETITTSPPTEAEEDANLQDAEHSGGPIGASVVTVEGSLVQINSVKQYSFSMDNDIAYVELGASTTYLVMGENQIVNSVTAFEAGFQYDLIVVGGNIIRIDSVSQTNVLLSSDTVTLGPDAATGSLQGSDQNTEAAPETPGAGDQSPTPSETAASTTHAEETSVSSQTSQSSEVQSHEETHTQTQTSDDTASETQTTSQSAANTTSETSQTSTSETDAQSETTMASEAETETNSTSQSTSETGSASGAVTEDDLGSAENMAPQATAAPEQPDEGSAGSGTPQTQTSSAVAPAMSAAPASDSSGNANEEQTEETVFSNDAPAPEAQAQNQSEATSTGEALAQADGSLDEPAETASAEGAQGQTGTTSSTTSNAAATQSTGGEGVPGTGTNLSGSAAGATTADGGNAETTSQSAANTTSETSQTSTAENDAQSETKTASEAEIEANSTSQSTSETGSASSAVTGNDLGPAENMAPQATAAPEQPDEGSAGSGTPQTQTSSAVAPAMSTAPASDSSGNANEEQNEETVLSNDGPAPEAQAQDQSEATSTGEALAQADGSLDEPTENASAEGAQGQTGTTSSTTSDAAATQSTGGEGVPGTGTNLSGSAAGATTADGGNAETTSQSAANTASETSQTSTSETDAQSETKTASEAEIEANSISQSTSTAEALTEADGSLDEPTEIASAEGAQGQTGTTSNTAATQSTGGEGVPGTGTNLSGSAAGATAADGGNAETPQKTAAQTSDDTDAAVEDQANAQNDLPETGGTDDSGPVVSMGDNLLYNEVVLSKVGEDIEEELDGAFEQSLESLENNPEIAPVGLLSQEEFDQVEYLKILYIEGDLIMINDIEQTNVLGDSDHVSVLVDEFANNLTDEILITTGSNILANFATINDVGVDSKVMVAGDSYSDALIYQAEFIDTDAPPEGVNLQGLTSEAVAFLADDLIDANPAEDIIQSTASEIAEASAQVDVMQSVIS